MFLYNFGGFQPVVKFIDHYGFTVGTKLVYRGFVALTSRFTIVLEYKLAPEILSELFGIFLKRFRTYL